ncbi:hypothetical protein BC30090_p232 (plasmid) [Bacillus cereus]|jgi:hypothetical protein|uniref:hypothetical protein n=1 Tax=Bacillus cereus group TaxID=86661 RepID=UPI0008FDAD28|nr:MULTISPECIES: hypothetical protein [Bacillus cereus group]MBL3742152.1 hypothetical protein [Bacillus cereus]MBL3864471.1 hypothetical protein [Bacillus cereus]MBL3881390.1 hypothetical protein [Bacillus cereus]NEL00275.1 hypothetical protein [Bacillus mobilis]OJE43692.1 hypothetical protein BAQ44_04800 [Bacillus mobilis]
MLRSSYCTSIGYHIGNLEVEIVIDTNYQTKEEAEKLENNTSLHQAKLDKEKLVINDSIIINKDDIDRYQFRLCKVWNPIISATDFVAVSWDEAIQYLSKESGFNMFNLESYYFEVHKGKHIVTK